jgi:hypothetical protein
MPSRAIRLLALLALAWVAAAGVAVAAPTTELTRRYRGLITKTDFPSDFPMGAPVSFVMTVDPEQQVLVSAIARFNGFEYRTTGPRPLANVGSSGGLSLYYASSMDVAGPTVGAFVPWIMTFVLRHPSGPVFSTDPFVDAQPFIFADLYQGAVGASGLTLEPPPSAAPSLVDLNGDGGGDALLYDPNTGHWSRQISQPNGGFVEQSQGSSAPGWSILPANFNGDALTDFFLFNTSTGQWAKMLTGASGFTAQATGGWWPGWQRYVMDLDGDGLSDLFLHDPATGVWFKCVSTPTGFSYTQGGWNPGWELYRVRLNGDAFGDLMLFSRATGRWFWALGAAGGGFTYPVSEVWFTGWQLYPGDFNADGLSDVLLHDPASGVYVVATTNVSGFAYQQGAWSLGWTPYPADFNGDGKDDLFLHAASTGNWFQLISDGAGNFTNVGGQTWSLGWNLYPTDLNADNRADIVLYDPATGTWYQARNFSNGVFTYASGTWATGLRVIVR